MREETANDASATATLQVLYLTVRLRGADPTALTAAYALRHRLGLDEAVRGLSRVQLWRFELAAADPAWAQEQVRTWVTQSQLFVNPNQHAYELTGADHVAGQPAPAHEPWIVVTDEPDLAGEAATRLIRERLGGTVLRAARTATIWRLELVPALAAARRTGLAEAVAVARGRTAGLLSNPHSQTAAVFVAATPALVGARLWDSA
jgi:hypothetical protein